MSTQAMSGDAAAAPSAVTVALAPSGAGVGSQVELRGMAAAGGSSKGSLVSQHSASTVTAPEASEPAPEKHPEAPLVEVRFENVSYHVDIPARADTGDNFPTVPKALAQIATLPVKLIRNLAHGRIIAPPRRVDILKDVSGVLRPGTLTLVTCPPGHGRSSYLRMCAKQLPADNVSGGAVTFSGSEDGKEAGCHLGQLVQYVNQLDEHLPYLTVKETLEFVHKNSVVDPAEFPGYEHLAGKHGQQVEDIKKLLNLGNCWNTIIGNQSLRGVSGGEKKRVTDAEGLLTSAQAILLDEPSTGLDSSVTYDIVKRLKDMTRARGRTIAIGLLQPSPETVALFDEVVLLREGQVVYHGPNGMPMWQYFYDLGFNPPVPQSAINNASTANAGSSSSSLERSTSAQAANASSTAGAAPAPVTKDINDYLVDLLAQPAAAYLASLKEDKKLARGKTTLAATASAKAIAVGGVVANGARNLPGLDSPEAPITTARLVAAWKASRLYTAQMNAPPSAPKLALTNDWARAQFGGSYSLPYVKHLGYLMKRQFLLYARNPLYLRARLALAVIMGIVIGGLYYQRTLNESTSFFSTFLNLLMGTAMANFIELANAVDNKFVAYKHVSHGTFPSSAYVLAGFLAHIPISIIATMAFSAEVYFMAGLYPTAQNFFFAWFVVFLIDVTFRNLICCFAFAGKNLTAAQSMPLPLLAILLLFAGFLIAPNSIPGWLVWVYDIDVFAWAVRALSINEFLNTPKYTMYVAIPNSGGAYETLGNLILGSVGMKTQMGFMWGGVGFVIGSLILTVIGSVGCFAVIKFDRNIGSRREAETPLECLADKVVIAKAATAAAGVVPTGSGAVGASRSRLTASQAASIRASSVRMLVNSLNQDAAPAPLSPVAEGAEGAPSPAAPTPSATASSVAAGETASDYNSSTALAAVAAAASIVPAAPERTVYEKIQDPAFTAALLASVVHVDGDDSEDEDSDDEHSKAAAHHLVQSAMPVALRMDSHKPSSASVGSTASGGSSSALPFEPTSIVWKDLVYKVTLKDGTVKTLLNGISGCAEPGKLLALMGASGAGKTTLMDVILGRKTAGKLEGQILVNGRSDIPVTAISAYCEQTDMHHSLTTIREAVQFSAALRLPTSVTATQRTAFVDEILELLELHPIAGRIVGTPGMQGSLAPAEFKKLTIAVELASNAPVVFLDEPTSGLDSRAAAAVMRVLRRIADTGRTIIATIHQPSAALFYQFDSLLLMQRGGYEVFFGDIGVKGRNIVKYLTTEQPICQQIPAWPRGMNVAGWMLSAIQGGEELQTAKKPAGAAAAPNGGFIPGPDLQKALFASELWKEGQATIERLCHPFKASASAPGLLAAVDSKKRTPGFGRQFVLLVLRQWRAHLRNIQLNLGRIISMIFLNLLFGVVWYMIADPLPSNFGEVQTMSAAIFFTFAFPSMIQMNTGMPPTFAFRSTYYRETTGGMYNGFAYGLANMVVEFPWIFFLVILSLPIFYFMAGFSSDASTFFFHYFCVATLGFVYWLLGQFLSSASPSFEVAQAIGPSFISNIFFLFGGMFSPISQLPSGATWVSYIDPIFHTFSAVTPGQYYTNPSPNITVTSGSVFVTETLYQYTSNYYSISYDQRWIQYGYLVCFIAVFAPLYLLSVKYVRWIVR